MPALVLDASVALEWCFPDENAEYAGRILRSLKDYVARVPGLWPIEVANAILVAERRKRLSASEIARFFQLIAVLPVELDDRTPHRAFGETMMLARSHKLTAYDATYLELAMREGLPLATLDRQLRAAAQSAGVPLVT